jgi:ketosteroid isomerase-like protein
MNSNSQLIEKFYTAFQQLDAAAMNSCYSDDIVFFDHVLVLLR